MTENVMKKQNSHVKPTKLGVGLSVYPKNGYVTEIQIVLMVPMRMPHYIIVPRPNLVVKVSSLVPMDVALTKSGNVTTTMTVEMVLMKEKSAIPNTRLAVLKSSNARISNASGNSTDVMERMTVEIILMKSVAVSRVPLQ